jgi:hypothetical protein
MYVIFLELIPIILTVVIAVFALSIGGYTKMLKVFYHLHFPPARFYFNAMLAIERLEGLDNISETKSKQVLKQGIIRKTEIGFKELTEILRENRMLNKGEVDEIILGELHLDESGLYETDEDKILNGDLRLTPDKIEFLAIIQGGKRTVLQRETNPSRIIQKLQALAQEITRDRVANWILSVLALYLIVSIYLAFIK